MKRKILVIVLIFGFIVASIHLIRFLNLANEDPLIDSLSTNEESVSSKHSEIKIVTKSFDVGPILETADSREGGLESLKYPRARNELINSLRNSSDDGEESNIYNEILISIRDEATDSESRQELITFLGAVGTNESLDVLLQFLNDDISSNYFREVSEAIITISQNLLNENDGRRNAEMLIGFLNSNFEKGGLDETLMHSCFDALGIYGYDYCVEYLIELATFDGSFYDSESILSEVAKDSLRRVQNVDSIPVLRDYLIGGENVDKVLIAGNTLTQIKSEKAVELMVDFALRSDESFSDWINFWFSSIEKDDLRQYAKQTIHEKAMEFQDPELWNELISILES